MPPGPGLGRTARPGPLPTSTSAPPRGLQGSPVSLIPGYLGAPRRLPRPGSAPPPASGCTSRPSPDSSPPALPLTRSRPAPADSGTLGPPRGPFTRPASPVGALTDEGQAAGRPDGPRRTHRARAPLRPGPLRHGGASACERAQPPPRGLQLPEPRAPRAAAIGPERRAESSPSVTRRGTPRRGTGSNAPGGAAQSEAARNVYLRPRRAPALPWTDSVAMATGHAAPE